MKSTGILMAILLIAGLFAIPFALAESTNGLQGPHFGNCKDTDGGTNYFVPGVVEYNLNYPPENRYLIEDGCYGSSLYEVYCDTEDVARAVNYVCPNGCSDAACIPLDDTTVSAASGVSGSAAGQFIGIANSPASITAEELANMARISLEKVEEDIETIKSVQTNGKPVSFPVKSLYFTGETDTEKNFRGYIVSNKQVIKFEANDVESVRVISQGRIIFNDGENEIYILIEGSHDLDNPEVYFVSLAKEGAEVIDQVFGEMTFNFETKAGEYTFLPDTTGPGEFTLDEVVVKNIRPSITDSEGFGRGLLENNIEGGIAGAAGEPAPIWKKWFTNEESVQNKFGEEPGLIAVEGNPLDEKPSISKEKGFFGWLKKLFNTQEEEGLES